MNQYQVRELLKQNAPKIYVMVQSHNPLPIQTEINISTQSSSAKDYNSAEGVFVPENVRKSQDGKK
jgi:hypothetical protein